VSPPAATVSCPQTLSRRLRLAAELFDPADRGRSCDQAALALGVACRSVPRHFRKVFRLACASILPCWTDPVPLPVLLPFAWQWRWFAFPFRPAVLCPAIPWVSPENARLARHNRFISFGISAAVNSRLQVNGLTFARVVKAK